MFYSVNAILSSMAKAIRWTEDQLAAHEKRLIDATIDRCATFAPDVAPPKPKKYRNTPTDGYASKREAKRAAELKLMQAAGQIVDLREQVKFVLIPKQEGERECSYVCDFAYRDYDGTHVVEDVKGVLTPVFRIKRKLMLKVHGIRIREVR